jgi:hypothetical protein
MKAFTMILPNGTHTHAFSPEGIAATPIPIYPREVIPWLQRDRKDAVEGGTRYNHEKKEIEPDGLGLTYATRELKRLERDRADAEGTRKDILTIMIGQQRYAVQFWEGKINLLDRIIAAAQGSQP